jgi:calcium permeable stress-gated cation channel
MGWFNWLKPSAKVPDIFVLNHSSLDGFLFLRYMKILCVIALVGCCITWPILLPVHVYGGGTDTQLDRLTFGNVTNVNFYYIHALVAWVYFSEKAVTN